jgi:predicted DNA-binding protein
MTARLNARIDDDLMRKIDTLREKTGGTVTDVVKTSIERYYEATVGEPSAMEILERVAFIGCAAGPDDLARTYKARLSEALDRKRGR